MALQPYLTSYLFISQSHFPCYSPCNLIPPCPLLLRGPAITMAQNTPLKYPFHGYYQVRKQAMFPEGLCGLTHIKEAQAILDGIVLWYGPEHWSLERHLGVGEHRRQSPGGTVKRGVPESWDQPSEWWEESHHPSRKSQTLKKRYPFPKTTKQDLGE